jgi:hypothetical protein
LIELSIGETGPQHLPGKLTNLLVDLHQPS